MLRGVLEDRDDFPPLVRNDGPGELTVAHLVGARDLADYEHRALAWGHAVWQSWAQHHALIREAVASVLDWFDPHLRADVTPAMRGKRVADP